MPTFPTLPLKSRCRPVDYEFVASHGLPPSFVHLATCNAASSLGVEGRGARVHHRSSGHCRFTPGALAPVRVIVSRSIFTYSAPCAHLRAHLDFAARRFIRDALAAPIPMWGNRISGLDYGALSLRPVDLLVLLSELTRATRTGTNVRASCIVGSRVQLRAGCRKRDRPKQCDRSGRR